MAGAHVYGCRMIPARLALAVLLMAAAPPVLAKGDAARGERIARVIDEEAKSWSASYDAQPLIDAVWALDRSDDVGGLAKLAVPV